MKTIDEIQTALRDLESAMVEKGVVTPKAQIHVSGSELFCFHARASYGTNPFDGVDYLVKHDETVAGVIQKARDYIAGLPSPEEAGINRYLRAVADAVDCGHEENIPDEYVAPLRNVTCAMTENLLENKS